jgi:hypothetical protein
LRSPEAQIVLFKVPEGPSDDRFIYLADVLPISCGAIKYADIVDGGSVTVCGPVPRGQMS